MILSEYSIGVDVGTVGRMYKYALEGEKTNFFLIDLMAEPAKMFRKNLTEYIDPSDFV
jgi:hypothetical protein